MVLARQPGQDYGSERNLSCSFAGLTKLSKVHLGNTNNKNYKMLFIFIIIYYLDSLSYSSLNNLT